jgi:hypothetical protein
MKKKKEIVWEKEIESGRVGPTLIEV